MEKTIPLNFIAFSIWYQYIGPLHKISWVFLYLEMSGWIQAAMQKILFRSKHKLWKMCSLEDFETRLIFCVLNSSTHTKWNMQSSLLGQFFHLSLRLNSPPVSYVTTVDAAWKNTGSFIASQRYKKRNFIAQIYFVNAFKKVKIKKLANNTKKYKKLVHFS